MHDVHVLMYAILHTSSLLLLGHMDHFHQNSRQNGHPQMTAYHPLDLHQHDWSAETTLECCSL